VTLSVLVDQDVKPRDALVEGLGDAATVAVGVDTDEDALIAALEGIDVVVTTSRLPLSERVFAAVDLSMVAKVGTGLNNVDLAAAADHGVTVAYTPGMNALSVAEHALTLMLAVRRNVVRAERTLQAGGWRDEVPNARPLTDTTVGLVGFGDVGRRLAGLLDGFHAEVLAYDPYVHDIETEVTGATMTDLDTVLDRADTVAVVAELTPETRGLIDADALDRMAEDAVLVNTSRGPIVDEDALLAALEGGAVAGAGLDVFETEPLPADSRLHGFENVVTTPHVAASSVRARTRIVERLTDCIGTHVEGGELPDRFVAARPTPE